MRGVWGSYFWITEMQFENLELVKEYPGIFLKGTKSLRIYKSKGKDDDQYRWHFGYPKEFIKPFCPLIETTPFWGEQHWTEQDGFYIWWLMIMTDTPDLPIEELNKENNNRYKTFAHAFDFLRK